MDAARFEAYQGAYSKFRTKNAKGNLRRGPRLEPLKEDFTIDQLALHAADEISSDDKSVLSELTSIAFDRFKYIFFEDNDISEYSKLVDVLQNLFSAWSKDNRTDFSAKCLNSQEFMVRTLAPHLKKWEQKGKKFSDCAKVMYAQRIFCDLKSSFTEKRLLEVFESQLAFQKLGKCFENTQTTTLEDLAPCINNLNLSLQNLDKDTLVQCTGLFQLNLVSQCEKLVTELEKKVSIRCLQLPFSDKNQLPVFFSIIQEIFFNNRHGLDEIFNNEIARFANYFEQRFEGQSFEQVISLIKGLENKFKTTFGNIPLTSKLLKTVFSGNQNAILRDEVDCWEISSPISIDRFIGFIKYLSYTRLGANKTNADSIRACAFEGLLEYLSLSCDAPISNILNAISALPRKYARNEALLCFARHELDALKFYYGSNITESTKVHLKFFAEILSLVSQENKKKFFDQIKNPRHFITVKLKDYENDLIDISNKKELIKKLKNICLSPSTSPKKKSGYAHKMLKGIKSAHDKLSGMMGDNEKAVASFESTCALSAILLTIGTLKAIKTEKQKSSFKKEKTKKTSSFSDRLIRQPFFQLGTGCAVSALIQYIFATGTIDTSNFSKLKFFFQKLDNFSLHNNN